MSRTSPRGQPIRKDGQRLFSESEVIFLGSIGIGVVLIWCGIARLRKKLRDTTKPTVMTYLNELGGYVIVAILAVICGVAIWISD